MLRTLIPAFLLILLADAAYGSEQEPDLRIEDTSIRQGGLFAARVTGTVEEPSLQFMQRSWKMFRQPDGSWRSLLPVENMTAPGSYAIAVRSGSWKQTVAVRVKADNRPTQQITLDPEKSSLKATENEKQRIKAALQTATPETLFSGRFLRPCPGVTSSLFGVKRSYNGGPADSYHKGIDIDAPMGTPVRSAAKGKVILTGRVEDGFRVNGNTVIIDHGQALISTYLHLSEITAAEGRIVEAGEVIGKVGHTGISTAPHLHWGIYLYGTSVNPELFVNNAY